MGKKFKKVVIGVVEIVAAIYTWGGSLSTLFLNAGINTIASVAVSAFAKTPRNSPSPLNITVRGTVEYRRLVFGTRRVGGVLVFYGVSGSENKYLWYVIAYAGHQSSAFGDFWLDERRLDSSIIPSGGGGTVTGFNSHLNIWKYLGTSSQSADTNLDSAFGAWTTNHKLLGTTYAVIRFERDDNAFPDGAPQSVSCELSGMLTYDARLDSTNGGSGSHRYANPSTWAFSRDPVQHIRWYLTGGSVHNDTSTCLKMYGLRDLDTRMDDAYTIAASNICDQTLTGANTTPSGDQPRYRCDLEVHCGETRREILQALLASMSGTLTYVHGKWRIYAGAYDSPVHTFTSADLYGDLQIQDTVGHDVRYNAVAPVFIDAGQQYIQTTGIYRTDSAYETQDGGERIPTEIQLDAVTDIYQAQRLAEIHLRKSRMMRTVSLVGALNLLKVAPHEVLLFSHDRYGWNGRIFRAKERQIDFAEEAGRVTVTAQLEDPGVWTDLETADYTTGTSATDLYQDDGLRLSLQQNIDSATFDGVSITAVFPFPDNSIAGHTTLASISYTPVVDTTVLLSATFTVDYTTATPTPFLQFIHSIQGSTYDVAFRQEWYEGNIGSGSQRKRTISIFRLFNATAGVAVTYVLLGSKFQSGDTVTANVGQFVLQAAQG